MPTPIRLLAELQSDQRTVQFYADFPAPAADAAGECGPAGLFTGDPQTGIERTKIAETDALCAPSAVTWVVQHKQALGAMTYASPGVHQATLRWGDAIATASFTARRATAGAAARHCRSSHCSKSNRRQRRRRTLPWMPPFASKPPDWPWTNSYA